MTPPASSLQPPASSALRIAWCHNGVIGGAKRAAHAMVRELVRRGHIVDEVVLSDAPSDYLPLRGLVRESFSYHVDSPSPRSRLRPYVVDAYGQLLGYVARRPRLERVFRRIAGIINARGYDTVHIDQHPFCHTAGLLPYLRLPVIVYSHEASDARYIAGHGQRNGHGWLRRGYTTVCESALSKKEAWKRAMDRDRLHHAPLTLTNSDFSRGLFFQHYGCLPKTCYLGVDVTVFKCLGLTSEPMVLSVGRLLEAKQHHVAIEAVGSLTASHRPRVVIAAPENAGNAIEESLQSLARQRGVQLTVVHAPSEEELVQLYNRALALVAMSVMEPLGLVVLEAMACGTPVIGVREGGIRELIAHGQTGLLVERDPQQIAGAITVLQQPQARARMGREAAQTVRARWTWQHTIDRYEQELYALVRSSEFGMRSEQHIPHSTLRGEGGCP